MRVCLFFSVGLLPLLCVTIPSLAQDAEGTLTVGEESVEIRFAYADTYEEDITVVLSDSELPREIIPDGTYEVAANGGFRGVIISVSSETKEFLTGGWYQVINAVHFHPILNKQGDIGEPTVTIEQLDDELIVGSVTTAGPKDVEGHQVSYEISFSASLKKVPLEVTILGADDDPSKAFEGWVRALFAGDIESMKSYFSDEVVGMMPEDEAEIAEGIEFQQMMMPNNVEILESKIEGNVAELKLKGRRGMEISEGTAQMLLENGKWKVGEQSWTSGDSE